MLKYIMQKFSLFYYTILACIILTAFISSFIVPNHAGAATLFEKRSWTDSQDNVDADFHLSSHATGEIELSIRWTAKDAKQVTFVGYKVLDAAGHVIKEGLKSKPESGLPMGMDVCSKSPSSKSADTEDWSTKNYSAHEETDGVGWRLPLGQEPTPATYGTNPDSRAAAMQEIKFTVPPSDFNLEGYTIECVIERDHLGLQTFVYPLGQKNNTMTSSPGTDSSLRDRQRRRRSCKSAVASVAGCKSAVASVAGNLVVIRSHQKQDPVP